VEVGNEQNHHCDIYSCKFGIFSVVIQGIFGRVSASCRSFRGYSKQPLIRKKLAPVFVGLVLVLALEQRLQDVSRGIRK
jgi:hypothetical protein